MVAPAGYSNTIDANGDAIFGGGFQEFDRGEEVVGTYDRNDDRGEHYFKINSMREKPSN